MVGEKHTKWNVIGENFRYNKKTYCLCRCDCGTERFVRLDQLRLEISKSCGCLVKDRKYTDEEKRARKKIYYQTERGKLLKLAGVMRYRKTEKGIQTYRRAIDKYRKNHPEIRKAHIAATNAIHAGKILKQPCEVCGENNSQAHHDDYSKPLIVRWLCVKHHQEHHLSMRNLGVNV